MAQKVTLVDDLDGTPIDDNGGTVSFSLDGATYEIDLSSDNKKKLHDALEDYIDAGRRVRDSGSNAVRSLAKKSDPNRLKAIREWANTNGHTVSDRGRIPAPVVDAYDAAH